MTKDDKYMKLAIKMAKKAEKKGEVPIGAIIVKNDKVVAKAHNTREKTHLATGHAEINVINLANKKLKSWRLEGCTLYVTIEPCPMCTGAIIQSRIDRVVYGARDLKSGCHESVIDLFDQKFNHKVEVTEGILSDECGNIITNFFKKLRQK